MGRYEGESPFQTKWVTWSDASGAGRVKNDKGVSGLIVKPDFSFEFDKLYAEPSLCHRVVGGEDVALDAGQIAEVDAWVDAYAMFGVDAEGRWIGSAPAGGYVAEATSKPPAAFHGEQWVWDTDEWVDGRSASDILAYAQNRKVDEMWAFTLMQIENDAIEVTVSAGDYWFGMDSNTMTNFERTLRGIDLGTVANPRPWTPKGEIFPISVTHDDIRTIAAARGLRYEEWITVYLTHKAAVKTSTDPEAVRNYDYSAGWPNLE